MTQSKNDKAPAKGGRSSASSLADAVVAALAQVEARDSLKPEETAKKEPAKAEPAKVEAPKAEPPKAQPAQAAVVPEAAPANVEPVKVEPAPQPVTDAPPVATADALEADGSPQPAVVATLANKVVDVAAPAAAREDPIVETSREHGDEDEGTEQGDSPTKPHEAPKVEQVVPRGPAPEGIGARYFGRTDVGLVREHNEDNFLVVDLSAKRRGVESAILETKIGGHGCVFAVCDGMGGAAAGEVASQLAVDTIHEVMDAGGPPRDRDDFARRLVRSVEEAGSRIFAAAKMDRTRRGMGTTATVAGLIDHTLFVGQVGDSRAYVLRGDQLALITKDQSLVNQLIEAGQLTEEEAEAFEHSNIILQALGTTEEVTVDLTFLELKRGDRLLLCSDGLSGLVHADMMKEVLGGTPNLVDAAAQLISMANSGGGHDNITVVLVEFDGTDLKDASKDVRPAYQQYPLPPAPVEEPKVPARAPQIKSGGAKPGADVKKASHSNAPKAAAVRPEPDSGGSPLVWIGATVLIILVLVAIAWAISGSGGSEETPPPRRAPVGRAAPAAPAPEAPAEREGTLRIATDVEGGELWINGERRGALSNAMEMRLSPGAYHLEARNGETRIAEATVTVASGGAAEARLTMPTVAGEALPPPAVEIARSELRAGEEPTALAVEGSEPAAAEATDLAEPPPTE
jgi:protein phosphatase